MRIIYIGKFKKLWDEEYIARSFESLGHTVGKIEEVGSYKYLLKDIDSFKPDLVIFAKLIQPYAEQLLEDLKKRKIISVSWVFDLYWNYNREYQLKYPNFKADYVFTTDGGLHDWGEINHNCVRQGIYEPECVLEKGKKVNDVIFVGSFNGFNPERNKIFEQIEKDFNFKWIGKHDSDEMRGMKLNRLYAESKIVIGDSVYSPHYWSNRIVETLGRGGFLIHMEVEGLKEEYPHLITYKRGNYADLKSKIEYYLTHEKERNAIIKKNYKWVKDNYTCEKQCQKLLDFIK